MSEIEFHVPYDLHITLTIDTNLMLFKKLKLDTLFNGFVDINKINISMS